MSTAPRLGDIKESDGAFTYAIRVDMTSDGAVKVRDFCVRLVALILNEPSYSDADVAVSVHRAEGETPRDTMESLEAQCQALWRTNVTLVCRLPKGHEGDHRADNGWTFTGECVVDPPEAEAPRQHCRCGALLWFLSERAAGHCRKCSV